jgi:hypothetical protein
MLKHESQLAAKEDSPALQRWVKQSFDTEVPAGTAEISLIPGSSYRIATAKARLGEFLSSPTGLSRYITLDPALKRWAIVDRKTLYEPSSRQDR